MRKILKRVGIVLASLLVILILLLIICYINHRIQLSKEEDLFQPIGTQVDVNGHSLNVYVEGDQDTTLVFMSGGRHLFSCSGF